MALQQQDKIDKAIEQMKLVLSLVDKDSKDYKTAKTQPESLEKKRTQEGAKEKTTKGETLTSPATKTQPAIQPPLNLPEEASPPAAPKGTRSSGSLPASTTP